MKAFHNSEQRWRCSSLCLATARSPAGSGFSPPRVLLPLRSCWWGSGRTLRTAGKPRAAGARCAAAVHRRLAQGVPLGREIPAGASGREARRRKANGRARAAPCRWRAERPASSQRPAARPPATRDTPRALRSHLQHPRPNKTPWRARECTVPKRLGPNNCPGPNSAYRNASFRSSSRSYEGKKK